MSTNHDDLIERSAYIHRPDGLDQDTAELLARSAIVIDAVAESIWAKLIDAAGWPSWYSNTSDVAVDGPSGQLGRYYRLRFMQVKDPTALIYLGERWQ